MITTKKQLIFQAFQTMDSSLLEMVLDEDKTYQDAEKQVFIQKIEEIFDRFKFEGDTALTMYAGVCGSQPEVCENCGKKGKRFVGNHSKICLDLIFEEEDGEIQDIYCCSLFDTHKKIATDFSLSIIIKRDEKADFKPSNETLTLMIRTRNAVEELTQHPHQIIGPSIYKPWLKKHNFLYKYLGYTAISYRTMIPFHELYKAFQTLDKVVAKEDVYLKALKEYRQLDTNWEMPCLRWLSNYEQLYFDISMRASHLVAAYKINRGDQLDFFKIKELKIDINSLNLCVDFMSTFVDLCNKMVEKYDRIKVKEPLEKTTEGYQGEDGLEEDDDIKGVPF